MGDRHVTLADAGGYPGSPRGPAGGYRPYDPSKTIYVGQLRYDTDERTVRKWFEAYGPVNSVKLIYDKETGRSKGFGFVTFEDDRDALDALNDAGGRDLDGAAIRVNTARGTPYPVGGGRGRGRGGGGFYGGRGAPYRPPNNYTGGDRRVAPGGAPGGERYSPGRYSPRSHSRSRSRSPRRYDDRYEDEQPPAKRRRYSRSPSRSRSQSHSRGSRSPSRDSRSPSRSPTRSRSPSPRRASAQNGVAAAPPGSGGGGSAPPAREGTPDGGAAAAQAAAPQAQAQARPAGGKPPPSAEAVKKELLRLRRQEKELGGRVRSLQEEAERRERELGEARKQLEELHPQLDRYKAWVAALLDGTRRLASSRRAFEAAEGDVKRREEALSRLHHSILAEAEVEGLHLEGGHQHMAEDDDAAWEQLAAEIQASEQVAAASMGHPSGRRNGSRPPTRAGAPTPQGPSGVPQDGAAAGAEAGNQQAAADLQLQAAMQEAIDEDDPAAAAGGAGNWTQAASAADAPPGNRFAGVKLTIPAA